MYAFLVFVITIRSLMFPSQFLPRSLSQLSGQLDSAWRLNKKPRNWKKRVPSSAIPRKYRQRHVQMLRASRAPLLPKLMTLMMCSNHPGALLSMEVTADSHPVDRQSIRLLNHRLLPRNHYCHRLVRAHCPRFQVLHQVL
jgi:hypothetical protein